MPVPVTAPPYYVVVFTSLRTPGDHGYAETDARLLELAAKQPGYLGIDSARGADGLGITVSYWRDQDSITAWRTDVQHMAAQDRGRAEWYEEFTVHVAKVERSYDFRRAAGPEAE